jgi:hypothetical protein
MRHGLIDIRKHTLFIELLPRPQAHQRDFTIPIRVLLIPHRKALELHQLAGQITQFHPFAHIQTNTSPPLAMQAA